MYFHFAICTLMPQLTDSSEQNPFCVASTSSAPQDICGLLWKPKLHYQVRTSPPLLPNLNEMNPAHIPTCFLYVHLNLIPKWFLAKIIFSGIDSSILKEFVSSKLISSPCRDFHCVGREAGCCHEAASQSPSAVSSSLLNLLQAIN